MSAMTVIGAGAHTAAIKPLHKRSLRERRLRLVIDDEAPIDLPEPLGEVLAEAVSILGQGQAVAIAAQNAELTTGEAAELLGVTRPTVVKLMEDGVLPFTRPNSSRRVPLQDVLAYKESRKQTRRKILDQMTAEAMDTGIYQADILRGRQLEEGGRLE